MGERFILPILKRSSLLHEEFSSSLFPANMDPLAERLQTERERQRRSRREMAAQTNIREQYLEALESGRYDVLPAVYVRSFLKTYATALGIRQDELQRLMSSVFDTDSSDATERLPRYREEPPKGPHPLTTAAHRTQEAVSAGVDTVRNITRAPLDRGRRPWPRILIGIAIIGACVVIWLLLRPTTQETPAVSSDSSTVAVVDVDAGEGAAPSAQGATLDEQDSMRLTAVATDTAWMTITMDGKRSRQLVLIPGQEYEWSAMERYALSIGNAGVVTFTRNGETLKPFGKKGELVRSIVITRTAVTTSNVVSRPSGPRPQPRAERPPITTAPIRRPDVQRR